MKIFQPRSFAQKVKRMPKPDKETQDQEIRTIADNPSIGEEKKGDLKGVFVHKSMEFQFDPEKSEKNNTRHGIDIYEG